MQYIRAQQGDSIDFYSVAQNKIISFLRINNEKSSKDYLRCIEELSNT